MNSNAKKIVLVAAALAWAWNGGTAIAAPKCTQSIASNPEQRCNYVVVGGVRKAASVCTNVGVWDHVPVFQNVSDPKLLKELCN